MIRILIIDSEADVREELVGCSHWRKNNCEVVGAVENSSISPELIKSLKPDLILFSLDDTNSQDASILSEISQKYYLCKIIITTKCTQFEFAQKALRLGAFRILSKPINDDELGFAVSDACIQLNLDASRESPRGYADTNTSACPAKPNADLALPDNSASELGENADYTRLVGLALDYIKRNYSSKEMSLKSVANEVFVSTWYLSKLIKRETGENYIKILTRIRLDHAKELLINPQYKVYEVAAMVGFDDVPHFTKTFKLVTGMSPLEYRRDYIIRKSSGM